MALPAKDEPRLPTQQETAEHFGFRSTRRVRELVEKGILKRGMTLDEQRLAYIAHLEEVAAGRASASGAPDLTEERARLASEQADAQALKNAELRGQLIRREDAERTWSAHIAACRTRMRAIPRKLIVGVPGFTRSMATRAQVLIDEALHELSGERTRSAVGRSRAARRAEDVEAAGDAAG